MHFELAIGIAQVFGDVETLAEIGTALQFGKTDIDIGYLHSGMVALQESELLQPLKMAQQAHAKCVLCGREF